MAIQNIPGPDPAGSPAPLPRRASRNVAAKHDWQIVTLGRVCRTCGVVQANGSFDDAIECKPRASL